MSPDKRIAVLGAGSWGTALAIQLDRAGAETTLWGRNPEFLERMQVERRNSRYLPDTPLPTGLALQPDLRSIVRGHRDLLICVPSHAFRDLLVAIRRDVDADARIAWATKGFDRDTGNLPHQVARSVFGSRTPLAVLSGPTFAREVGLGLPTAMTVAATDPAFARDLAARISSRSFRAYTSDDLTGVEVGGAVKNVLAIGAGISDGLGFGANTRIALITRGLVEMSRLGTALGGLASTFMGLSGMGDLVLTCTDDQSRNRRLGMLLATGLTVARAAECIGQVVEGVYGAATVQAVAARLGIEMPICEQVFRVLHEGAAPEEAVRVLMSRALRPEADGG